IGADSQPPGCTKTSTGKRGAHHDGDGDTRNARVALSSQSRPPANSFRLSSMAETITDDGCPASELASAARCSVSKNPRVPCGPGSAERASVTPSVYSTSASPDPSLT